VILWATHLRSLASVHFELQPGRFQLGRATPHDPPEKLSVPFDPKLSRRTAQIEVHSAGIVVEREGSRAPLFVEEIPKDRFELKPGQRFSVAETIFELAHELAQTVTAEEIDQARKSPTDQVLEMMLALQLLFQEGSSIADLARQINEKLPSSRVALFEVEPLRAPREASLTPSKSLATQACQQGAPVYYEWSSAGEGQPTAAQGESWALAAPIFSDPVRWLLYAVGQRTAGDLERGALCLLAQMIQDHLEARRADGLAAQAQSGQAHDPKVRKASQPGIQGEGSEVSLRLLSLGEFECYSGGVRLDREWGGKQLSWLLSYLVSARRTVTEDSLLEALWPEKAGRARKNLSVALSRLRSNLRREEFHGDPIPRNHTGYALHKALTYWHDYQEILELLDTLSQEDCQTPLDLGRRLLELYRGPYLEGCSLEWAVSRRTQLETRIQEVCQLLADFGLKGQAYREALQFAQRSLDLDPCCQESHLVCMRSYLGLGRPEQAVRQFEVCQRTLATELQMEPSLDLLEAHQRSLLSLP
jgi:DNA-binding SARP family transcriptional activator